MFGFVAVRGVTVQELSGSTGVKGVSVWNSFLLQVAALEADIAC